MLAGHYLDRRVLKNQEVLNYSEIQIISLTRENSPISVSPSLNDKILVLVVVTSTHGVTLLSILEINSFKTFLKRSKLKYD